jgi:hypothetical protein
MSFKLLNRVRMTLLGTPGTGTLTLNAAAAGFQDLPTAGMVDGDTCGYVIDDGNPVGLAWEIGTGTYHSNGTFVRNTVVASSVGGTTKISVTSAGVLSATFRAQDLTAVIPPTPAVVQYVAGQITSSPFTLTLPSAPTAGNLLVLIGNGGGYGSGNAFAGAVFDQIGELAMVGQYQCNYALRRVRSGDGTTYAVGSVQAGGTPLLNVVLVEVSGVDVSKLSLGRVSRESIQNSAPLYTSVNVACNVGELCLFFCAGDPQTISVTGPTMAFYNTQTVTGGGSTLTFGYRNATSDHDGFNAAIAGAGGGAQAGAITLALSGF